MTNTLITLNKIIRQALEIKNSRKSKCGCGGVCESYELMETKIKVDATK